MRRNNIRKLLLWIVIPAVTSFLAGVWFTLHGVNNIEATIWLAIILVCTIDAYVKRGIGIAISVVLWILEAFTGFLYIKVLAGFLGEFGIIMHLFVLLLFLIMVLLTINYGEIFMQTEGIKGKQEGKHSKENQEDNVQKK